MKVTVYCGANFGNKEIYKDTTVQLGNWIADNNYTLVYGGGNSGLMGVVADTVTTRGANAIGVIPTFLKDRELLHPDVQEVHEVETMSERKQIMANLGDAFIALPGGAGTLEEISEVFSWAVLGQNDKPCIFINKNGYYDHIKNFYAHMVEEGFMAKEYFKKMLFTDNLDEVDSFIKSYVAPEFRMDY